MYAIYDKIKQNSNQYSTFAKEISLAGCNVGIIPKHLREKLQPAQTAPIQWELNIENIYSASEKSIIIDIKPNRKDQVLMGELTHVFGDSYKGSEPWTPVLFRLKIVAYFNELSDIENFNKQVFRPHRNPDVVYTMGHLRGSVFKGDLIGTWSPGRGSLNSLLLWSSTLNYFVSSIRKTDPDLIVSNQ